MIGVGVFSTLSFQVISVHSVFAIMLLWVLGGIAAMCGALSYAELAASMPRSGGEYNFLSRIYHPIFGFLSGWISLVVGFSAPIALAAMAMSGYIIRIYPHLWPKVIAVVVVSLLAFVHGSDVKAGGIFQSILTVMKIALILVLVFAGLMIADPQPVSLAPTAADWKVIFGTPAFAVALVFVNYAYSGWNASAYIAGEIENPQRNMPRSLIIGTLIVMGLYLGINFIFLYTVPMSEMATLDFTTLQKDPELAVGFLAGKHIFGDMGGKFIAVLIAFGLVSTISSMTIAGPRVMKTMGQDFRLFSFLTRSVNKGAPLVAVILQTALAIVFIVTSTFEDVITYVGFTLSIFASLTVAGVYVMRIRHPELPRPYKTPGYPVTPAIFLIITGWMVVYVIKDNYRVALVGLATVLVGVIVYFIAAQFNKNKPAADPSETTKN